MIGAHSMIERPEPVNRVAPPREIITSSMKQTQNSQTATGRRERVCATRRFGGASVAVAVVMRSGSYRHTHTPSARSCEG